MTSILALDTSSENCSVALSHQGEIYQLLEHAPRNHTKLILPMIQDVLAQNNLKASDLGAIAFGCGPGSFTGIRIAAGVAQGLAFGLNIPIYAISNLQALALQNFLSNGVSRVLPTIDARMGEVYWGLFDVSEKTMVSESGIESTVYKVDPLLEEQVSAPGDMLIPDDIPGLNVSGDSLKWSAIGSGLLNIDNFPAAIRSSLNFQDEHAQPEASTIVRLTQTAMTQGVSGSIDAALPSYVRDTVTWNKLPGR